MIVMVSAEIMELAKINIRVLNVSAKMASLGNTVNQILMIVPHHHV